MDKVYIGRRLENFYPGIASKGITKVELLDENGDIVAEAGESGGKTLTALQPDGTGAMAAAILQKVSGYAHAGYEGRRALIDPAAEIGDALTIDGHYVPLVDQDAVFDALFAATLSAPDADELDDEYPFKSPTQRQIERSYARARSLITKTSGEIMLRVEGVEGDYTELKTTLDGVTITDSSGTTRIKGSSIDTGTLAANSISADKLNLTGAITFGDLNAATQQTITAASNNAAAASNNAAAALNVASAASSQISAWSYGGTTYIDGSKLMTGTVMASKLLGGTVGLLASNEMVVGSIDIAYTTTGIGLGINTTYGGIQIQSGGNVFLRAAAGQVLTVGGGYFSFGGGTILLPTACYGNALPSSGNYGQVFFLLS